ncbi:hypothetical protein CCP3SC1AL1_310006 [Gammaproteobacteria bacterium]
MSIQDIPVVNTLISASQNLTNAFANLGSTINVGDAKECVLWAKVDIGTSTNVQFKIWGKIEEDSTDLYEFPIKTITASLIKIEDEVVELNVNVDQNIMISFTTNYTVPYIQIQVKDSASGTGAITEAYLTKM